LALEDLKSQESAQTSLILNSSVFWNVVLCILLEEYWHVYDHVRFRR